MFVLFWGHGQIITYVVQLKNMEYLAVLGRLPKISLAELESQFGEVTPRGIFYGNGLATFKTNEKVSIDDFGGILKFGRRVDGGREAILRRFIESPGGKITLGVSDYRTDASLLNKKEEVLSFDVDLLNRRDRFPVKDDEIPLADNVFPVMDGDISMRDHLKLAKSEALAMKRELKNAGRSVRILENKTGILSTATSHHNQLAEKANHVEVIMTDFGWYDLTGVQNITKYAKRDQARPARDAKVGMLPPKLAQIMLNLCGKLPPRARILDPFCGTGVVLQEAFLKGFFPYGTDIDPRMVQYTRRNLDWLGCFEFLVEDADARNYTWGDTPKIDAVVTELYLGQPMSNVPNEVKIREEKEICREILMEFLKNIHKQLDSGTPLVLAVPAWRRLGGGFERLGVLDAIEKLGYNVRKFRNLSQEDSLYYREDQIVARELIVLRKQ